MDQNTTIKTKEVVDDTTTAVVDNTTAVDENTTAVDDSTTAVVDNEGTTTASITAEQGRVVDGQQQITTTTEALIFQNKYSEIPLGNIR